MYTKLREEAREAAAELFEKAKLRAGMTVVVGCSTSEVCGEMIGSASVPEAAEAIYLGLADVFREKGIYIAAQCCEHLNRAIIIEREAAKGYDEVNVVPMPKAGGSFATAAYKFANDPVAIEEIKADAGLDIGQTLIGMHLKAVAVPVRLSSNTIGSAYVTFARTRPRCIGGIRAVYDDSLM